MKGMIIGEESEADTGDERARGIKGALSTTRNVVVELGQGAESCMRDVIWVSFSKSQVAV